MAYRIQYGKEKKHCKQRDFWRLPVLIVMFFLLFLFCAKQRYWQQLNEPMDVLLEDLRSGASMTETVDAFFQGLLEDD